MHKGFADNSIALGFLLCASVLTFAVPFSAAAQSRHSWQDGAPQFLRIASAQNVRIDSTVGLMPIQISSEEPAGFAITLSGIDWVYQNNPAVLSVEDFDYLPQDNVYLITDGAGRKVIAIRPDQYKVWEFGAAQSGSPNFKPVDAFSYREGGNLRILVTDQDNHRVLAVDFVTQLSVWQYGGTEGSGFDQLSRPADAVRLSDSARVLICDSGNNRVIMVDEASKNIVWSSAGIELSNPVDVEYSGSEKAVLITDQNNHRVILVSRETNSVVWQFGVTGVAGSGATGLKSPADADLLADGSVLICDTGNKRLIQVNRQGEIVWSFHRALNNLVDADRLSDKRTLAVFDNLPQRLAYKNEDFISSVRDFGRPVNFDSLYWQGQVTAGVTAIRLQLRSANVLGDLGMAPWLGPGGEGTYYTETASAMNAVHDGSRFLQYIATLETLDVLQAPVLTQARVAGRYFQVGTPGIVTSEAITDSPQVIITNWSSLILNTVLPSNPVLRSQMQLDVRLLDASSGAVLHVVTASNATTANLFDLKTIASLRQKQALRLEAVFNTNNSSVTPRLNDWSLSWEYSPSTKSALSFVDSAASRSSYYRASAASENPSLRGAVFVVLDDPNLRDVQSTVNVTIVARRSGDVQTATLVKRPTGIYTMDTGLPIVVSTFVGRENNLLEASDRDSLLARYTDPTDPTDTSTATAVVIRNVTGALRIENEQGVAIDTASVGATLFLRLTGELDRNITPAQDSVRASFFNNITDDVEDVWLVELRNGNGNDNDFSTGEFVTAVGMPVVRSATSVDNDGRLQALPGHQIGARYKDLDNTTLEAALPLFSEPDTTVLPPSNLAFDFLIAPNPYRLGRDQRLGLRALAYSGAVELRLIEIYNVAGDRVRAIDASEVRFDRGAVVPRGAYATSRNWWNLRTNDGELVASGTYWAKISVRFTSEAEGKTTEVSMLRKFIILQ